MSGCVSKESQIKEVSSEVVKSFGFIFDFSKHIDQIKNSTKQQELFDALNQLTDSLLKAEYDINLTTRKELLLSLEELKAKVVKASNTHERMSEKADELINECDVCLNKILSNGKRNISTSEFQSFLLILEKLPSVLEPYFECLTQLQEQGQKVKSDADTMLDEMEQETKKKKEDVEKEMAATTENFDAEQKRQKEIDDNKLKNANLKKCNFSNFLTAAFKKFTSFLKSIFRPTHECSKGPAASDKVKDCVPTGAISLKDSILINKTESELNAELQAFESQINSLQQQLEGFRCDVNELNALLDKCEANVQLNENTKMILYNVMSEIKYEIQRREEIREKDERIRRLEAKLAEHGITA